MQFGPMRRSCQLPDFESAPSSHYFARQILWHLGSFRKAALVLTDFQSQLVDPSGRPRFPGDVSFSFVCFLSPSP